MGGPPLPATVAGYLCRNVDSLETPGASSFRAECFQTLFPSMGGLRRSPTLVLRGGVIPALASVQWTLERSLER